MHMIKENTHGKSLVEKNIYTLMHATEALNQDLGLVVHLHPNIVVGLFTHRFVAFVLEVDPCTYLMTISS